MTERSAIAVSDGVSTGGFLDTVSRGATQMYEVFYGTVDDRIHGACGPF